jgi:hypothetical protein
MKVEIQSPSRFLSFKNGWISYELVAPTVKSHLARIFQKFNVASRAAAVAAQKGLLGNTTSYLPRILLIPSTTRLHP